MIFLKKLKLETEHKIKSRLKTVVLKIVALLLVAILLRFIFFIAFVGSEYLSLSEVIHSIMLGLRFDFRAVIVALLPSIILIFLPVRPNAKSFLVRSLRMVQTFFLFFFFLIYAIDFGHYAYMHARINASFFDLGGSLDISLKMAWETYPLLTGIFTLSLLTVFFHFIFEQIKHRHYYIPHYSMAKFPYRAERMILFMIIVPLFYGKWSAYPLRWSDAYFSTSNFLSQWTLNPVMNLLDTMQIKDNNYDEAALKKSYPLLVDYLGITQPDAHQLNFRRDFGANNVEVMDPALKNPHIILIQVESMADDKSSVSGNPLDPTPELQKIVHDPGSIYFPYFFSPTEATARGLFAVLTGIPDVTFDKSSSRNPLISDQDLIVNQLPKEYEKFYFLGGSASWGNIRSLWTSNVADIHMYEEGSYQAPRGDVWGISDLDLFKESFAALNKTVSEKHKPIFAYIQTAGFHRPYTIPESKENFQLRKDVSLKKAQQHGFLSLEEYNSMRFQDFSLGYFLNLVRNSALYPNVIVAMYGDHGLPSQQSLHVPEGFYRHRVVNHHIPFVIWAPSLVKTNWVNNRVGSQVDIFPTVMSLAHHSFYTHTLGRNLLDEKPPRYDKVFLFSFQHKPKHISMIDQKFLWENAPYKKGLYLYHEKNYDQDESKQFPEEMKIDNALSEAIYQAAKYLRFHNKKPVSGASQHNLKNKNS